MTWDDIFNQRSQVALKLKKLICDKGYTKASFAKKAEIPRTILDKILNGDIDSKTMFNHHMQRILEIMQMSVDDFMLYSIQQDKTVTALYSQNAPENHEMSDSARKQYDLLLDIIDLCAIYYI